MNSIPLLEGIKSKVIFRYLFSHIKEKTKFKLVIYSKKFQYTLNLSLRNYKEKCFESFKNINLLDYLSMKNEKQVNKLGYYSFTNRLQKQFNNKIKKLKFEDKIIEEYIEFYFKQLYNEYKNKEEVKKDVLDKQLLIDIYSPFYELLMDKDIFEKLFMLYIPFPLIYKRELLNDYYDATDLLKESNPDFSSFYFELDGNNDLYDFKDFCKYFNKIRKLYIEINHFNKKFKFPYEIFQYKNIKKNLIYLEVKFFGQIKLNITLGNLLSGLSSLEELRLDGLIDFHLHNKNLKYLYLANCKNLSIESDCYTNLRILNLFRTKIPKNISLIKIPELILFKASFCIDTYKDIFDLTSCQKLKYISSICLEDFLNLRNNVLEKVYIKKLGYNICLKDEIEMIKKLIEIKTLKEIKIYICNININNINYIESIEGENRSVEKLIINIDNNNYMERDENENNNKIILYSLQKKFPNLKELEIYLSSHTLFFIDMNLLEINPNPNCKINKFKYSEECNMGLTTIFDIAPYEDLLDIEFGCLKNTFKLDGVIPLFSEKCNYIFKSLIRLKFDISKSYMKDINFNLKILENIINNIDKMPKLKIFIFKAECEITDLIYKKIIEKLLISNIKNIELSLDPKEKEDYYSQADLQKMFKGINITNFETIKIRKLSPSQLNIENNI